MKSTDREKVNFSFEDFEKGLMLAGYLMPKTVEEILEREAVNSLEDSDKQSLQNIYFKRIVLAAEIAFKLNQEPSLGRVKFQKLVYLCENAAEMHLESRYQKQAAGPFDNKFMHTIAKEFKKNKWFDVEKEIKTNYTRYKYTPLENADGYKKYYENYFSQQDHRIQFIIELFRKKSTDYTELATTVFACLLELKSKGSDFIWQDLLNLFYAWSDKKKRFKEDEIRNSFDWLIENGLVNAIDR